MKFIATSTPWAAQSAWANLFSSVVQFWSTGYFEAAHNEHDKDGGWDETNYGGDKNFPFSHWNLSDHVPLAMVRTKETMGPHHSITGTTIITKWKIAKVQKCPQATHCPLYLYSLSSVWAGSYIITKSLLLLQRAFWNLLHLRGLWTFNMNSFKSIPKLICRLYMDCPVMWL